MVEPMQGLVPRYMKDFGISCPSTHCTDAETEAGVGQGAVWGRTLSGLAGDGAAASLLCGFGSGRRSRAGGLSGWGHLLPGRPHPRRVPCVCVHPRGEREGVAGVDTAAPSGPSARHSPSPRVSG